MTPRTGKVAFVVGTAGAGLAGALYVHQVRYIDPDSFGFEANIVIAG